MFDSAVATVCCMFILVFAGYLLLYDCGFSFKLLTGAGLVRFDLVLTCDWFVCCYSFCACGLVYAAADLFRFSVWIWRDCGFGC